MEIGLYVEVVDVVDVPVVELTVWTGLLQSANQTSAELVVVADCIEAVVNPVDVRTFLGDPDAAEVVK